MDSQGFSHYEFVPPEIPEKIAADYVEEKDED